MPVSYARLEPWAPHKLAAPRTARDGDRLLTAANGTRACAGGWQAVYRGLVPNQAFRIRSDVVFSELDCPREALKVIAIWSDVSAKEPGGGIAATDVILPTPTANGYRYERVLVAPEGVTELTVRLVFRWSAEGAAVWTLPVVDEAKAPRATAPVRIAVVTGHASAHQLIDTVDGNLELFTRLCRTACREKLDLLVLPEICVHWGVPGSPLELGTTVPGPETQPFQALAAEQKVRVCLPLYERDGDAVYNTAVLIGPDGQIDGRYRKVHLASEGEEYSGLLPGDGFPVFDTEIGRVGCNICMDSSAVESSRMVGLNGADFLLLPIMGDHRADRFTMGPPRYNESRWQAIMRTRAMDNQFCLVAARNGGEGSCIVDNRGEILAWNEGNRDFIAAQVPPPDHRLWTGGRFREVNWMQRRPQLYGPFVDPACYGGLRER